MNARGQGLRVYGGIKRRSRPRSVMFVRAVLVAVVLSGAQMVAASTAIAAANQQAQPVASAVPTVTIEGYDVDFTLPTAAKAGCMVCHEDEDLTRVRDGRVISYFVDPDRFSQSAHGLIQCTGCHLDFAFSAPHEQLGTDWSSVAKSACGNCHREQAIAVGRGAHRLEVTPTAAPAEEAEPRPLCGDCHGSHEIEFLTDDPQGRAALHARGWEICGRCHQDYWDSYNDYYHGAAYKRGATDAPACWDCHGFHEILPAEDRNSMVNERRLVETCATCHPDANEAYVDYARFIHGREEISEQIFLSRMMQWMRETIGGLFGR